MAELILRSKNRRAEFKSVWGVSPRCINKKRTVKTVINAPEVAFSEENSVPNVQDDNLIDDQLSCTQYMFDHTTESKAGIAGDDMLEKSISNDLFELYIDANFDKAIPGTKDSFNDINSTTLNTPNIDEIIPSIQVDSFLENLTINTENNTLANANPVESETAKDKSLTTIVDGIDNFEEIDMDMEILGNTHIVTNEHNPKLSCDHTLKHTNSESSLQETFCTENYQTQLIKDKNNLEEPTNVNEKDEAIDRKSSKSVRFLNATPIENALKTATRIENNHPISEQKISRPKNISKRRSIQVQIPVHFRSG